MKHDFEAIVVGAGQAGIPMAVRLAEAGHRTLLVERKHLGGTCVNDGCTPTKAMIASARAAHVARTASHYGISTGEIVVDMAEVKARKDLIVQGSIDGLRAWLGATAGLTYMRGHARFIGPEAIAVGEDVFTARRIFINVGARPTIPPIEGISTTPYLTSSTIMSLNELPRHLVIIGASYIGLEFAQMFRRFGSEVTVLERGERPIGREDPDISNAILSILQDEAIAFRLGVDGVEVSRTDAGVRIGFDAGGIRDAVEGSHLLVATGRSPNTDDLGLDAAGIATDADGFVIVDDRLRTNLTNVWALGDVNGRGAFTHTSWNDYEIAAENILNSGNRILSGRIPVYGLFIDPPLGRVGATEASARASGRNVLRGVMPMTRVGRARERGETKGLMKVLVDADSGLFLGAAFLGIEGDEAVQTILDLMAAGVPFASLVRTMHIHPTVCELIPTLLGDLKPL